MPTRAAGEGKGRGTTAGLAGMLSGMVQVFAEHPLDTVKIRMQSSNPAFAKYGVRGIARRTARREGGIAFMQGVTPRLLTYGTVKFTLFSIFERARNACGGNALLAGAAAGAINTAVSCPQDVLKSRLQMEMMTAETAATLSTSKSAAGTSVIGARSTHMPAGARSTSSLSSRVVASFVHDPLRLVRQLTERHGSLRWVYVGWRPLVLRDTIGYAGLFSVYTYGTERGTHLPVWLWGGLSGLAFYLPTLPLDRVKTIMMTQPLMARKSSAGTTMTYKSATACFEDIYRQGGLRLLYRGATPALGRTFVGQAAALSVYNFSTKYMLSDSVIHEQ